MGWEGQEGHCTNSSAALCRVCVCVCVFDYSVRTKLLRSLRHLGEAFALHAVLTVGEVFVLARRCKAGQRVCDVKGEGVVPSALRTHHVHTRQQACPRTRGKRAEECSA